MSTSTIVGNEMLPVIQKGLSDLDTAEKELELARRAGLFDTASGPHLTELVKKVSDARNQLMNLKQVYFPGQ